MNKQELCAIFALAATINSLHPFSGFCAATNINYIGGGGIKDWFYPANWEGGIIPTGNTYQATIATDSDVTFTNGGTALFIINRIITSGSGLVTLNFGTIQPKAGSGYTPSGAFIVGPGGARVKNISFGNTGAFLETYGNLNADSTRFDEHGFIYQRSGTLAITTFRIANGDNGSRYYTNWSFVNSSNMTLTATWQRAGTIPFHGTPVFADGRPKWQLVCHDGGHVYFDLRGHNIYANAIEITGTGSTNFFSALINTNAGGRVDANAITIGTATRQGHYLSCRDFTITLGGSGTVYYNYSTNANLFCLTNNTVLVLCPTGGTASIHTGSQDRGGDGVTAEDWEDNFALDRIQLAEGASITLVGNANIGSGTNAVYATTLEGLGTGATVVLNNHNVYLKTASLNVFFNTSGGGQVILLKKPVGTVLMIR